MTDRNRAWRRRQQRRVVSKIQRTKNWIKVKLVRATEVPARTEAGLKHLKRQTERLHDMRLSWKLDNDLREANFPTT